MSAVYHKSFDNAVRGHSVSTDGTLGQSRLSFTKILFLMIMALQIQVVWHFTEEQDQVSAKMPITVVRFAFCWSLGSKLQPSGLTLVPHLGTKF